MASRPTTRTAVRVIQQDRTAVLLLFADAGTARSTAQTIMDGTDGAATYIGPVHDLPMVVNMPQEAAEEDVRSRFASNFARVMVDRELVELRGLEWREDCWTATALWAFPVGDRPAVAQEA